jgi:hypothetical protein
MNETERDKAYWSKMRTKAADMAEKNTIVAIWRHDAETLHHLIEMILLDEHLSWLFVTDWLEKNHMRLVDETPEEREVRINKTPPG